MTDPEILKYIDQFCVKKGDVEVKGICYDGLIALSFPVFNGEQGIDQTATIELEFSYDGEEATLYGFPQRLLSNEDYIYTIELIEETMQQAQELQQLAEKYGFKIKYQGSNLHLCALNTDGEYTPWISYNDQSNSVSCHGNTDHLNIWLYDTRKDMTPEKCISFVGEINNYFGLSGKNRISIQQLIDPEDWQEIAHVQDAFKDERYMEGKQNTFSDQIQALTHVDDYSKKVILESVEKKQSIDFRLVEPLLYDHFGNRKTAFEVDVFDKGSDGNWHRAEQLSTLAGSFYVLGDDQNKAVFSEINGRLYPMNMDFYSRDCHRCYSVGKEIPVTHKITGNAVLAELQSQNGAVYRLKRQDYSDTPPFYYFANSHGDFRVNHGNHDLKELFGVLKHSFPHDPVLSDSIAKLEDSMCRTAKSSLDSKIQSASLKADSVSMEGVSVTREHCRDNNNHKL